MNWLYIIVMAYIVASALRGFHKGFIRVVYSMAALLITVLFVTLSVPFIVEMIQKHTPIAKTIETKCENYIQSAIHEELLGASFGRRLDNKMGIMTIMPETLFDDLMEITEDTVNQSDVIHKAAEAVTAGVLSAIALFVSTAVIRIIIFLIGKKLDIFARTPGIHMANMVLGFCAGIVKAFLVIWTAFLLIKVTAAFPWSAALIKMIEENDVLQSLYEQNRLVEILEKTSFLKT